MRPSQSPDLDMKVFGVVCQMRDQGSTFHKAAAYKLKTAWSITIERPECFYHSIPRHVCAVIRARGNPTKY